MTDVVGVRYDDSGQYLPPYGGVVFGKYGFFRAARFGTRRERLFVYNNHKNTRVDGCGRGDWNKTISFNV